ncbi:MAG: N-acetylmuramic acid 6-phosphate etherase [Nitrospirae bacterium]|nr:N-acetylmuramic acid 6-phosphate etherase [Nitrospirota bacterium]
MNTEDKKPHSSLLDTLPFDEIITLMNYENLRVMNTINSAKSSISSAINDAAAAIQSGGSLIYIGAGTSGRLGVLDASEIPPTFGVTPDTIKAIIAGGERAITNAVEGAEDDEDEGRKAVNGVTQRDMLLGITASGSTPFTISALREGKRRGAKCWLLTCNDTAYDFTDGIINLPVGPEIIAGSTRLKAGTATKIVLNMISTAAMIKLGKVYKNYMVDVIPSNTKLRKRALNIIQEITACGGEEAETLLDQSGGNAKTSILMYMKGLSCEDAKDLLKLSGDSLRKALGE